MTKEQKAKVVKSLKEGANKDYTPTTKETKDLKDLFELAKQPIALTDDEFKLGECEVDIRKLSEANYKQMMFRLFANNLTWTRNLHSDLNDVLRLLMLVCDKLGIDDISKANDELEEKIRKQHNDKVA